MSKPNTRMLMGGHGTAVGYQVFTTSGVWNWGMAGAPETVDLLLIGGGGSSGTTGRNSDNPDIWVNGGGGSSGEIVTLFDVPVSGNVDVIIGEGGTPGANNHTGINGSDTFFGTYRAGGGGGGGGTRSRSLEDGRIVNRFNVTPGRIRGGGGAVGSAGSAAGMDGWSNGNPGLDGGAFGPTVSGAGAGYGTLSSSGYLGVTADSLGFGGIPGIPTGLGASNNGGGTAPRGRGIGGGAMSNIPTTQRRPAGGSGLVVVRWGS